MHHKCKSHSQGSGAGAIAYLMGLKDSKGRMRAGVEVLRGNPEITAQLIDSLKTKNRYTSVVVAWTKEDDPTRKEIQAVTDDWECVAFAGLRKSQYTYCAVLHTEDDGSKHIHIIVPRVNLEDGRALNIAPPGHEYYFAKWRNVWNFEKGWARPDDPARARLVQPGHKAYLSAEELRSGMTQAQDSKQMITDWLSEKVAAGEIENRFDVLEALGELGEINRVGKDYVSVRLEAGAKPIRLKGLLYGDNFSTELIRANGSAQSAKGSGREDPNPAAAAAARVELEAAVRSRAQYNESTYSKPVRLTGRGAQERQAALAAAQQAVERIAQAAEYRARYLEPGDAKAPDLVDVVAARGDRGPMPGDDWIGNAVELAGSEISQQSIGTNTIRSADEITTDKQRILQQSSGQKDLHTDIVKNYPTSIVKNYNASDVENLSDDGLKLIVTSGENDGNTKTNRESGSAGLPGRFGAGGLQAWQVHANPGLHEPGARWPRPSGGDKYAPGLSSLPTLSSRNLDAVWQGADMLLPAPARRDLVQRTESSAQPVRRANSRPGAAASQGKGVSNESTRTTADAVIAAAHRVARAAGEAVDKCIAAASAAVRSAVASTQWSTANAERANRESIQACQAVVKAVPGVKRMADDELERFKCDISLTDFAQSEFGYELDKKESSGAYFVLRSGNDKIIVTRDKKDNHDVYFNNADSNDSGSIIDFVKNRVGDNNAKLVRVRQALRPWAPGAKKPAIKKPTAAPQRPIATPKDRAAVVAAWKAMAPYEGSYLTQTRKLDQRIIDAFDVRQDGYGNACFKHLKQGEGVTGFEMKNAPLPGQKKSFTKFADGGDKALMVGRLDDLPVSRLVIVEAAIDALSYAQMHHKPGTFYVSTGGSWSDEQALQLKELIAANPKALLVMATDNDLTDKNGNTLAFDDRPGEKMAKRISAIALDGMSIERHTPAAKDWNKDLTNAAEAVEAQEVARVKAALVRHQAQEIARQRDHGM